MIRIQLGNKIEFFSTFKNNFFLERLVMVVQIY